MIILEHRATSLPTRSWERPDRDEMLAIADRLEQAGVPRAPRALRACGRLIQMAEGPGAPLRRVPCNQRFCPGCQGYRQWNVASKHRPRILQILGEGGGAAFITLNPGAGQVGVEAGLAALARARKFVFQKQAWKKVNGWKSKVGLLLVTEIAPGKDSTGHPHHHVLVFSRDQADAGTFATWMMGVWMEAMEYSHPNGQGLELLGRGAESWGPRLSYVLKGTLVRLDWPEALMLDAVKELTSGHNHFQCLGLLRKSQVSAGRETVPGNARKIRGGPENPGQATA